MHFSLPFSWDPVWRGAKMWTYGTKKCLLVRNIISSFPFFLPLFFPFRGYFLRHSFTSQSCYWLGVLRSVFQVRPTHAIPAHPSLHTTMKPTACTTRTFIRTALLVFWLLGVWFRRPSSCWQKRRRRRPPPPPQQSQRLRIPSLPPRTSSTQPLSLPREIVAGYYSDPNHPHCPRIIQVAASLLAVSGTDGPDGGACLADGTGGVPWAVPGRVRMTPDTPKVRLWVDFSSKGGPPNLVGVFYNNATGGGGGGTIQWEDGNTWSKLANIPL